MNAPIKTAAKHGLRPGGMVHRLSWLRPDGGGQRELFYLYEYSVQRLSDIRHMERREIAFIADQVPWDGASHVDFSGSDSGVCSECGRPRE